MNGRKAISGYDANGKDFGHNHLINTYYNAVLG